MRSFDKVIFTNNRYIVRFARNKEELQAAQRLRFNVFNVELGEGLERSHETGLDEDKYDNQCHHLLVISKSSDEVIGTYRMQTYDMARKQNGFYTAEEFDMSGIDDQILHNSIEVGRACIAPDHRNGRVLFLLWRGLAKYLSEHKKRYLFGCCSLTSQSQEEAWRVMKYLESEHHLHDQIRVSTAPAYECKEVAVKTDDIKSITLPQLFRLYINLGAKVCSQPAMDREFKTIDYLVLLDIENLQEHTRILFFS